jgi:mycothiol synthase
MVCAIIRSMSKEPVWVAVDPNSASPDFWIRYHKFRRMRQMETRPDDPVRPDELEEKRMRRDDPFEIDYRCEAKSDGLLLGWFFGRTTRPGAPEYETNKHLFWADIYVRPDHRRHGLAKSLLPLLLELVDRHGCTTIGMDAEEPAGHEFLKWLGADVKFVGAENRLNLAGVDWRMLQDWSEAGPKRSPATKLEVYDGPLPESMLDDYAPQFTAMLKSAPFENLDIGEILVTPEHMREWYAQLQLGDDRIHTVLAREPDGTIGAVTEVIWAPHSESVVRQLFTGVREDTRGRGLGKWIKAAMLLHIHELYPQVRWVTTDNAGSNAPMLAINKRMGFKEYRAGSAYQISRDGLTARLKNLTAV